MRSIVEAVQPQNLGLLDWLVALGVGGLIIEIIRGIFQRKRMGGDYADRMASAASALVDPLRRRVQEADDEVSDLRRRLRLAENEVEMLRSELADARHEVEMLRDMLAEVGHSHHTHEEGNER